MMASSTLPSRFRGESSVPPQASPASWLAKKSTPLLQLLTRLACSHPVCTIVSLAVLASTLYISLLQHVLTGTSTSTIFDITADFPSLLHGARNVRAGLDSHWQWENVPKQTWTNISADNHLALLGLVFPRDSSSETLSTAGPMFSTVHIPQNISVTPIPLDQDSVVARHHSSVLVYAVPFAQAAEFLSAVQEIPHEDTELEPIGESHEERVWMMKASKSNKAATIVQSWQNGWANFVDILQQTDKIDIAIMMLAYLFMNMTFLSLFMSMRRLGSNFWLSLSTLFSSTLAFVFGLAVTHQLGVPVNIVMLSEGLPFLVATIGFEKAIILTKTVLDHVCSRHRPTQRQIDQTKNGNHDRNGSIVNQDSIKHIIQDAVKSKGYDILRSYAIEIVILVVGATLDIQGGLRQFCFLASWILFFDCILLFTFYMSVLQIKLEIKRIKRLADTRRALEDDGVSARVAEKMAKSQDTVEWPAVGNQESKGSSHSLFMNSNSIIKFKLLMVSGFVLINIINIRTFFFSSLRSRASGLAAAAGDVGLTTSSESFEFASNGLDAILAVASSTGRSTLVTVLSPIVYELQYPSMHYSSAKHAPGSNGLTDFGAGGRMVSSLLTSLKDPLLSKWIVVALFLSISFNGYLFNVARTGIEDSNKPSYQKIDPVELARAERINDTGCAAPPPDEYDSATPQPSELLAVATPTAQTACQTVDTARPGEPVALDDTSVAAMERMVKDGNVDKMTDEQVIAMSMRGKIPGYSLERSLKDCTRAVKIRRTIISRTKATASLTHQLDRSALPYEYHDWERVFGACCENVIGYMPLPVGVAGPLVIDGKSYFLPMATTEGVLVASTNRGCKAINSGGGAVTILTGDGMTRGPCISFDTLERAGAAKLWLDSETGQAILKKAFDSTSRFARLQSIKTAMAGTSLYIRFKTTTGDAMGMNMISKGVEHALDVMVEAGFEDMRIVSLTGNYCIDKKPAAINWIDGRGKGVVAEAIIPASTVKTILKSDVDRLVELNVSKNLIGSAMAGSIGGYNAQAANIVAAIFLATGQDPAQVVESCHCITMMKNVRGSLQISVSMPSLEVGTLGGGTILEPQSAMLDLLGVRGSHPTEPGENARRLARIIAAATLAGELSLCAALEAGHLVQAHMAHNRSAAPSNAASRSATPGLR
ncbi:hypothetical protein E4U54_008492 [Claviceps lovelessii]|nr:hypothetical protein E4U54_008492 [Claviceps lovelessii]